MAQPQADTFAGTLDVLASILPAHLLKPRVGIVCGSGLSTLASSLRDKVEVPYSSLKGFGKSTVEGHKSALAFGLIGEGEGVPVVAMLGRVRFETIWVLWSIADGIGSASFIRMKDTRLLRWFILSVCLRGWA